MKSPKTQGIKRIRSDDLELRPVGWLRRFGLEVALPSTEIGHWTFECMIATEIARKIAIEAV